MGEQWTLEEVAKRFEECVSVLNQLPDGGASSYAGYWPEIIYTQQEINRQPPKRLRLCPLPDAIDRMEETLKWIMFVDDEYKRLVWLRAYRMPWREIARCIGVSPRSAGRYWTKAMESIVDSLKDQYK